jgi:ABC-type dipeptide/oligopeptide/nickel transport system permease component
MNDDESILFRLGKYFYNILPFPKKVCAATYLENGKLACSTYEYKLIDFGSSSTYMKNVKVEDIIKEKCSMSFSFGIIAYALQCLCGYPLGVYLAKKENKLTDKAFNIFHIFIRVLPTVIYFYLFVILFMVVFKLPVLFDAKNLLSYIAPLTSLTIVSSVSVAYFVRKYILIELDKDYVKFAISKGLNSNTILFKHVLRNAIIPFIRTIPSSILMCFSGFYILEASFNIPGVGLTLIHAIQLQDAYLIRGLIIFFIFLSMIAFLTGDVLTIIFKRKIDLSEGGFKNERS